MIVDISKQRLDYDTIAHLYDEPIRDYEVDQHLLDFLKQEKVGRVLDLGCGTGKQLTADSQALSGIHFVGADLFRGMLGVARRRGPGVSWVQADNANAPFASASFDYITNQFNYQHVQAREKMVAEFYRLLRPGGRFVLNNIDPWQMREWQIYQVFPAAWALDAEDFLPVDRFVALLETAGFTNIRVARRPQATEVALADVHAYVSRRTAASQMMAIPDADYEAGIRKLEEEIAELGGETAVQSTICFLTITADKP